jgi:heptosyltransferase-2
LLGEAGARWVGLNPGAAFGRAKRWWPDRYAALAERLGRRAGARVAILGSASERPLAERIAALLPTPPRILCGETDLGGLVGVLSELRLLITNDSGPMHLASALGTSTLGVFGPTDWRETAPRGARAAIVRQDIPCAPCKLRECPIDHRCMREVTVDRVTTAALELMS